MPMTKLASQLRKPAMDMAGGRGPCLKSSAPMNCGMEPTTKRAPRQAVLTGWNTENWADILNNVSRARILKHVDMLNGLSPTSFERSHGSPMGGVSLMYVVLHRVDAYHSCAVVQFEGTRNTLCIVYVAVCVLRLPSLLSSYAVFVCRLRTDPTSALSIVPQSVAYAIYWRDLLVRVRDGLHQPPATRCAPLTEPDGEADDEAADADQTDVGHPVEVLAKVEGHRDGDGHDHHDHHANEQQRPTARLLHQRNLRYNVQRICNVSDFTGFNRMIVHFPCTYKTASWMVSGQGRTTVHISPFYIVYCVLTPFP